MAKAFIRGAKRVVTVAVGKEAEEACQHNLDNVRDPRVKQVQPTRRRRRNIVKAAASSVANSIARIIGKKPSRTATAVAGFILWMALAFAVLLCVVFV